MNQEMFCSVYREADSIDCANGGLTSRYSRVVLISEGMDRPADIPDDYPVLVMKTRENGYVYAEPVSGKDFGKCGWMMGGNFIYSPDSRWPTKRPIPVHDRQETWEVFYSLSV